MTLCKSAVGVLTALLVFQAEAAEIRLQVNETEGIARQPAMVTAGIPFAKGALPDVDKLAVKREGQAIPAQFIKTVSWEDGSVRWALMDIQTPVAASGRVEVVVSDMGGNVAPPTPVKVIETADALTVDTGPMVIVVSKKKPCLLESVKVDGKERMTGAGRGLAIVTEDGSNTVTGLPSEAIVEQAGPMRTLVRVRGVFPGVHSNLVSYTARLTVWSGARTAKLHVWLENNGAMGYFNHNPKTGHWTDARSPKLEWFPFKGMMVDLGLAMGNEPTVRCEGVERKGALRVNQTLKNNWEYTITSAGAGVTNGLRTDGVVRLTGEDNVQLSAAIRNFWLEYPKAIETDGQTLSYWLWPVGGRWPLAAWSHPHGHPDYTMLSQKPVYWLTGGVHKGHELMLDFSGRNERECYAELNKPLFAFAPPAHYAATEAAPGLFAASDQKTPDRMVNISLAAWTRMARNAADPASKFSVHRAMEGVHGVGWMNYGDMFVFAAGHVGLHYDWSYIALLNAMRLGDMNGLRLGGVMARHRIDVDQMWSDRDLSHINMLQRGGGSVAEFHFGHLPHHPPMNANWVSGVVLHYMLTGEPKARECAMRNGEGLRRILSKSKGSAGHLGVWSIYNFMAMYRLTAERAWLDEALALFNACVVPVWKGDGTFLHREGTQFRGQGYAKEDIAYCYAIAVFCELHHLTGDETVMKFLEEGTSKPFPSTSFFDAPLFLSDLYAYVGLKKNNAALFNRGAAMFSEAFPMSKSPPVFEPGVAGWSEDKAMMLRAGHTLQFAASRMAPAAK